jgi:hypothetical protein
LSSQDVGGGDDSRRDDGAPGTPGFAEGELSMEEILDAVYRTPRRRALEVPEGAEPLEAFDGGGAVELEDLGALRPIEEKRVKVVRRRSGRKRPSPDREPLIKPRDVVLAIIILMAIGLFVMMQE